MITKSIKRNHMKNTILATLAILATAAVFALALGYGWNKQEIVDCNTWAQQANAYPAFYLTHWQKDQCDAHGITINAPVK